MPCYDPRDDEPLKSEFEEGCAKDAYARGEWDRFYRNVTKRMLEQWLCEALRNNPCHEHCLKWWEIHQQREEPKTNA